MKYKIAERLCQVVPGSSRTNKRKAVTFDIVTALCLGSKLELGSESRDTSKSLVYALGFVNALLRLRGAQRASRKGLAGPGHTIMGVKPLSMPRFNEQSITTTLPAHRWPAPEGFRYQDTPAELNREREGAGP